MRLITVCVGFVAGLLLCELGARALVASPATGDRIELRSYPPGSDDRRAHCYPERGTVESLPYDLRDARARGELASFLSRFLVTDPMAPEDVAALGLEPGKVLDAARSLSKIAELAPLCVTYRQDGQSPRRSARPAGCKEAIALVGDSFTVGQGVAEASALPARLAAESGACVRSYAEIGANADRILAQLERALSDLKTERFSRIIYVLVLNDPPATPSLRRRLNEVYDLMNLRSSRRAAHPSFVLRALGSLGEVSRLASLFTERMLTRSITAETLNYYRELLDPERNPGVASLFEALGVLRDRAARAGARLELAIYPMMIDLASYPLREQHRQLVELARLNGLRALDLLPAFEREQARAPRSFIVHANDHHPNGEAHAIAARELARSN